MEDIITRENYGFKYFFNAGLDRDTMQCDEEGSIVCEKDKEGHYHIVGEISWVTPKDIEDMTDEEFHRCLAENGIF